MNKILLFLLLLGTVAFNYSMEQSSFIPEFWVNTAAVNASISNQAITDTQDLHNSDIVKAIKIFLCHHTDCDYFTEDKSTLRSHQQTHAEDPIKEIACGIEGCEYKHYKKANLYAHKASCHSGLIFVCNYPGCIRITDTKKKLKQHKVIHTKDSGIKLHCDFCGFTNYSRLNLNAHIRRNHKRSKRKAH